MFVWKIVKSVISNSYTANYDSDDNNNKNAYDDDDGDGDHCYYVSRGGFSSSSGDGCQ